MRPPSEKSEMYKTVSTLNRAFAYVVRNFERLEGFGLFRRKYIRAFKNKARELQAAANEEILETLQGREEADWAHYGRLVRAFDRQYENDSSEARNRKRSTRKSAKESRATKKGQR